MKTRQILAGIILIAGIMVMLFLRCATTSDQNSLILSGNIEVTEVNVGFKIAGRVLNLLTEEGKRVAAGDRIAEIENAELASIVSQNRASVRNAESECDSASKDHERLSKLYSEGVISTQQMDSAKTTYDIATSRLLLAQASLRTSEVRLRDTVIFSPLTGVVLKKNVEPGEIVSAGTPIVTIGDLINPWVKVYVQEDKLGFVKLGQKVQVKTDTYPDRMYSGSITFISSEAEFTPKTVQTREERVKLVFGVKVSVQNQNNELKPGMPADVKILLH